MFTTLGINRNPKGFYRSFQTYVFNIYVHVRKRSCQSILSTKLLYYLASFIHFPGVLFSSKLPLAWGEESDSIKHPFGSSASIKRPLLGRGRLLEGGAYNKIHFTGGGVLIIYTYM